MFLHTIKQKKSIAVFDKVVNSLHNQLDLEKQKSQLLNESINLNYDIQFKTDILKKQVKLLEIISNK